MGKQNKHKRWHRGGVVSNYNIPVTTSEADLKSSYPLSKPRKVLAESTIQELANYIITYAEQNEKTVYNLRETIDIVENHMLRNALLKKELCTSQFLIC